MACCDLPGPAHLQRDFLARVSARNGIGDTEVWAPGVGWAAPRPRDGAEGSRLGDVPLLSLPGNIRFRAVVIRIRLNSQFHSA